MRGCELTMRIVRYARGDRMQPLDGLAKAAPLAGADGAMGVRGACGAPVDVLWLLAGRTCAL